MDDLQIFRERLRILDVTRDRLIGRLREKPDGASLRSLIESLGSEPPHIPAEDVMDAGTWKEALLYLACYVNGAIPAAGMFPDCIAVADVSGLYTCSGVMIADRIALTAAHCGTVKRVLVGDSTHAGFGGEEIDAKGIATSSTFDATLIELDHVPALSPGPTRGQVTAGCSFAVGDSVAGVGFGLDPVGGSVRGVKQVGRMKIDVVNNTDPCGGCVAKTRGSSACSGDSGGPLYVQTGTGQFLLVGIAQSFRGSYCSGGSVFTRIDSDFMAWVRNESGVTLARACP